MTNAGPLMVRGTYSWTKSRTIGVKPQYRENFVGNTQFQPGATFQYLPEHTWALGITYVTSATTVGLNVTGTGQISPLSELSDDFTAQYLASQIRLPMNRQNMTLGRRVLLNSSYALADLTASHRLGARIEGVLQMQNLGNQYRKDYYGPTAVIGRQTKVGVRIR